RAAKRNILINGIGAVATALTAAVVVVSKFAEGAWMTLLLIPGLMLLMSAVRRHYDGVDQEIAPSRAISTAGLLSPLVVVPVERWDKVSEKAIRFALTVSKDVQVVHIDSGEEDTNLFDAWWSCIEAPIKEAGLAVPEVVVLKSPYRYVVTPVLNYVLELERGNPEREIAVVLPNLVER